MWWSRLRGATSSPWTVVAGALAVVALLWIVGYGWARAAMDPTSAAALAPAFGLAAIALAAIVSERLGLPLDGSAGPTAVSAVAGGGGYVCLLLLGRERTTVTDPAPQIDE